MYWVRGEKRPTYLHSMCFSHNIIQRTSEKQIGICTYLSNNKTRNMKTALNVSQNCKKVTALNFVKRLRSPHTFRILSCSNPGRLHVEYVEMTHGICLSFRFNFVHFYILVVQYYLFSSDYPYSPQFLSELARVLLQKVQGKILRLKPEHLSRDASRRFGAKFEGIFHK